METNQKLETEIGNKEPERLKAEKVNILDVRIEPTEKYGEKAVFIVKHPSKSETLNISKVRYVDKDKIKTSGTWYKLDEDQKLFKLSSLARLLVFYGVENLKAMIGKEVDTELDDAGYLVFKAY